MSTTTEETVRDDSAPVEPFHIVCNQETSDPVVWIGICVEDTLMKQFIRDNEVLNPYLLVVITTQSGHEVERHIAPLTDGIVHHAFRRAGEFKIMATVVYEPAGDTTRLRRLFNYKESGNYYATEVLDWDGDVYSYFTWHKGNSAKESNLHRVYRHPFVASTTVMVQPDNFAKERAPWRTALVRTFFKKKGQDECNWRKRWLASLALCVVWLPLQYLIKIVGLLSYGLGGFVYGLDMQAFLRPGRRGGIFDMFGNVNKRSWWLFKRSGKGRQLHARNLFWCIGFVLTSLWAVVGTVILLVNPKSSLTTAMISAGACIGFTIALVGLVLGSFGLIDHFDTRSKSDEAQTRKQARLAAKNRARVARLQARSNDVERQLESLSCKTAGQPMTIDHLLERRKTSPMVIWNKTKDAVCRPFQE